MTDTTVMSRTEVAVTRLSRLERPMIFVGSAFIVGALAAAKGGYYPSSWSWAAAALAVCACIGLLARPRAVGGLGASLLGPLVAFGAWELCSFAWARSGAAVFEAERTLVYVLGAATVLVVVRRVSIPSLLGGMLTGLAGIQLYAVGTRLLPDHLGSNPFSGNRLSAPIGYWNGLGMSAVLGLLIALAFATRGRSLGARALGGLALPVPAVTLYFTYSRGSWLVLGLALVVLIAFDPRRLQVLTVGMFAAAPALVAVALAWHARALGNVGSSLLATVHQGHRLALYVTLLCLLGACVAAVARMLERSVALPDSWRRAYGAVLAAAAVASVVVALLLTGGPIRLAERGWHSFTVQPSPVATGQQESSRLFTLSNNHRIELWRAAWQEGRAHPLIGNGAGSYTAWWLKHRTSTQQVRDAHSLYLQTFGEVGAVGLALLVLALAVPFVAAFRARRVHLVPFAFAAYVAFLVHAAGDWDWQLPGVTLPALLAGAAIVTAAGPKRAAVTGPVLRAAALSTATAAIALALLTALGNVPLTRAIAASSHKDWATSGVEARRALRWLPWSGEPRRLLGEAELAQGRPTAAARELAAAASKDPGNWQIWFDLSAARRGAASRAALRRAAGLNPLSPEIQQLRRP